MSENVSVDMSQHFYRASAADFKSVPGSPLAYWISDTLRNIFSEWPSLGEVSDPRQGLATTDNNLFCRNWQEVSLNNIGFNCPSRSKAEELKLKWFPFNKGGGFRKWYGNNDTLVNWENDGREIKENIIRKYPYLNGNPDFVAKNANKYFLPGITWGAISSAYFSVRWDDQGFIPSNAGMKIYANSKDDLIKLIGFLNTKLTVELIGSMSATLNFDQGLIKRLPVNLSVLGVGENAIFLAKKDWDSYETSWDFSSLPLLAKDTKQPTLEASYKTLRANWLASTLEMQRLEEENNRIFIDAYGLEDELTPEVPLNEITLTCNPHYRYRGDLTEQEREDRLQSDTIVELISYAIGCMMGRYSLDREGLVYANENNDGFTELVAEGAYKSFPADDDGILALTAEEWFEEDIANRFREFLAQVWGKGSLQQNIDFVAQSLCLYALKARSGETSMEVIRRYLSTQFFKDHMSMYKRRPIYWLFSSGKHKAFECLVYLHRYNESTLARMRTEYVIPHTARLSAYATRLAARIEAADSTAERNRLNREQKKIHDQQAELAAFDEQLRHAADQRIQLDLDDGVKVNYGKFGNLLAEVKAITGK